MSSILTNNGAMVALQTLKSINANLSKTQDMISTGKSVATARDNAAVWAISKVMESDVEGFKGISDSLALGSSTVAVGRQAAETVTDLLTQMKGKIVAAQEQNVDRAKIQTDIVALRNQINSVVGAAQFNGLNLLSNSATTAGSGTVNVLSSLDRSSTGVISASIGVRKQDLTTKASNVTGATTVTNITAAVTLNTTQTGTVAVNAIGGTVQAGQIYSIGVTATDADLSKFDPALYTTGPTAADAQKVRYIARDGDTTADIAKGLAQAWAIWAAQNNLSSDVLSITASGSNLAIRSNVTDATDTVAVRIDTTNGTATIGGGLERINSFNVTTDAGARTALAAVEFMIQTAVDSAAAFGSVQGRIDTQAKFVSSLSDALKSGIGTLVDAKMEEASARLQALQVQQQLGIQALSIANQAPQNILALFR